MSKRDVLKIWLGGQGKRYYYRKTDGKLGWVQNKKSDKTTGKGAGKQCFVK